MPLIRKERAGNDSFGNSWPEDGAVVDVTAEHAAALLVIDDGGFSEVAPAAEEAPEVPDPDAPPADPDMPEEKKEISEVDPEAPKHEPESKAPAKKTAARKTAASKPVEE